MRENFQITNVAVENNLKSKRGGSLAVGGVVVSPRKFLEKMMQMVHS